jgi:hypothetical protein
VASSLSARCRSAGLNPPSFTESSARPSCWVSDDGFGRDGFILLLPDDGLVVQGAAPEAGRNQELVQVSQRGARHPRPAKHHPGTGDGVEHPGRHHRDHARRDLDVHDVTADPLLGILLPHAASTQRMPTVVDDYILPDMGRMTLHLP